MMGWHYGPPTLYGMAQDQVAPSRVVDNETEATQSPRELRPIQDRKLRHTRGADAATYSSSLVPDR